MVVVFRLSERGAARGGLCQSRFNLQNCSGFLGRLLWRVAGQGEHLGHVRDVLLANLLEAIIVHNIVIAVGQREAGLSNGGNLLGRVFVVLLHVEVEQRRRASLSLQFAHQSGQFMGILEVRDALEGGFQRLKALLLHQIGVHAGGKIVAILFFQRACGVCGRGVQLLPEQIAVTLLQQRE